MKSILSVLAMVLILALAPAVDATTYYVDKSCSTSGAGTSKTCGMAGPFKTIKEAVELSGLGPGDEIQISGASSATYTESGIATKVDGTSGSPIKVTRYRTTGEPTWQAADHEVIISIDHDWWEFTEIDFDGNNKTAEAIATIDGANVTISHSFLHDIDGHGVSIHDSGDGATIEHCTFDHMYADSQHIGDHHGITTGRGDDPGAYTTTGLLIQYNTFDEIAGDGVQIFETSASCRLATVTGSILNNSFRRGSETNYGDYGENGVDVKARAQDQNHLHIKGNQFLEYEGYDAPTGSKPLVIQHCAEYINIEGNIIDGNGCDDCLGIVVSADKSTAAAPVTDIYIAGNLIYDLKRGIELGDNASNEITNLEIYNNSLHNVVSGLRVRSPINGSIKNNISDIAKGSIAQTLGTSTELPLPTTGGLDQADSKRHVRTPVVLGQATTFATAQMSPMGIPGSMIKLRGTSHWTRLASASTKEWMWGLITMRTILIWGRMSIYPPVVDHGLFRKRPARQTISSASLTLVSDLIHAA